MAESASLPSLALALLLLGLLPLALTVATAFGKIFIVLGLLRHALGVPRVPPDLLLAALALLLTALAMAPTLQRMALAVGPSGPALADPAALGEALGRAAPPLDEFLTAHSDPAERRFLDETMAQLRGPRATPTAVDRPLLSVAAFALTELSQAFRLGLLLFLPFLVVDLVVASALSAAGLGNLPTERLALPCKLLLFVLADGWHLLLRGLLLGYGG